MKFIETFRNHIKNTQLRPSIFKLYFQWGSNIGFEQAVKPDLVLDDAFYMLYLQNKICDTFNFTTMKFEISINESMQAVIRGFHDDIKSTIYKVCPAKKVRQTKFFKEFNNFVNRLTIDENECNNTIMSLMQYYHQNITNMTPDTKEGKTFYSLLQALVKKYKRFK